jgi:hypothetical protein
MQQTRFKKWRCVYEPDRVVLSISRKKWDFEIVRNRRSPIWVVYGRQTGELIVNELAESELEAKRIAERVLLAAGRDGS